MCHRNLRKDAGPKSVAKMIGLCHYGLGICSHDLDVEHGSFTDHVTNVSKDVVKRTLLLSN